MRLGRFQLAIAMWVAFLLPVRVVLAHEIPRHVGVRAYVAPAADRVRLLVQIPMDAVRDVDFPVLANDALDVSRAAPYLHDAAQLWVADAMTLRDGSAMLGAPRVMAVRAALPSDRAFDSFGAALTAVSQQALPTATDLPHGQLRLEVLLEVATSVPIRDLVIEPRWANLGVRTTTVLTLVDPNGTERRYSFDGNPGEVRLDPRWWHAAWTFVQHGMAHMLGGIDHLLFVLCLVLPFRQWRPLVGMVTAFTVAHSITLIAAALGFVPSVAWFAPLVEVLIAASIVYMAIENVLGARVERRWIVAFIFGLVHGFGFSSALGDTLQFAGAHLVTSLLAFNVGVELAQLGVLLVMIPLLDRLLARIPERAGIVVLSTLVAHEAWHWMTARFADVRAVPFAMPAFDAALAVTLIRVAMAVLVLTGVAWALSGWMRRLLTPRSVASAALALAAVGVWSITPMSSLEAQTAPRTTKAGVYTADQAVKGREVFNSNCLGCHTTATHQGPAFTNKWFGRALFDLYDYVSQAMPKAAPGSLTEDEYVWVTAYILRLNGMPPGRTELSPEPAWLKSVRVDSTMGRANGTPLQVQEHPLFSNRQFGRAHDSRLRARTEHP
ncbi:HupE/UreJ family protein [Gemmatimonas sp.]|uniref:HupE/UreJ family protein n=1 Tax=Gemmatimonas sp. TaxID=1962908 RepID=UPI0037BEA1AD